MLGFYFFLLNFHNMHGHFVKFDIYVLKFYSNALKVVSNLQVVDLPFKPQLEGDLSIYNYSIWKSIKHVF